MHGLGNDYIYIDCMDGTFGGDDSSIINDDARLENISVRLSNHHTSIGGDGIIMILPSEIADFRMRMFNADGSEGRMCGNATRCIGKYVYDNRLTSNKKLTLETASGVKYLSLVTDADDKVSSVTVDMGEPDFEPSTIPVVAQGNGNVNIPATLSSGKEVKITAVSMGNPHGVVFVDNLAEADVHGTGAELETHAMWPDRANIEFAEVKSPSEIVMRVCERGSGETMACGTGACATAVAAALTGRASREVTIKLLGGNLQIRWDDATNHVFMTGSATLVFTGEVQL